MKLQDWITTTLTEAFEPTYLDVVNESHQHNVPPNSETHFKVTIASEQFAGKRLLTRHKSVNKELEKAFDQGLHALALHTYTQEEWSAKAQSPDSPNCLGGGRT